MTAPSPAGTPPQITPVPYHRLPRLDARTARWWRPVTMLLLSAALYAGFVIAGGLALVVLDLIVPGLPHPSDALDDPRNPADMVLGLGMIAALVPAVVLGSRWGGGRRGLIHSVVGRMRWSLMLRAGAVVVPVYVAVNGMSFLLAPPADASMPPLGLSLAAVMLTTLVLTPLQCAGEEYAFRGLPQLALGTWLRSPLWGIVVPVPLFVLGHGYHAAGQVLIAVFALCTGFLVWKSGGLELAIVLHTANNLPLALMAPLSPSSLQQGAVDPGSFAISLALTLGTTTGLTWWVSRIHGVRFVEPVRGVGHESALARDVPSADSAATDHTPGGSGLYDGAGTESIR
ncbi:CPBP family intramembrane glutamic endopeptidase [Ruania halotolerans]|uniref:CPBP family intramembrane glutamic endopeptidase n=1 Tax=Ruania halotolerans TaxID=2897773 RepID=UPI001E57B501|nr:CPBP family intramembrane glutamic endopeptidase [Ruania halotolerans]UFU07420.1 CPBP family intramembrane metalloprotease [Ruania halotolerans]